MSTSSHSNSPSTSNESKLTIQEITKNFKKFDKEKIDLIFSTPELIPTFLSVFTRLSDQQMEWTCPHLTVEQVKNTIPKLQLQQSGVCVLVMNPAQIRAAFEALPSEDRILLANNIQLLSSCSNKEDVQSIISFIDPLALCVAIKTKSLKTTVLEAASVMTKEQIRTIVPLLTSEDISQLGKTVEDEVIIELILSMVDQPSQLSLHLASQLPELNSTFQSISPKLEHLAAQIPELENRIEVWKSQESHTKDTFDILSRAIKTLKSEIETSQLTLRGIQRACILPRKALDYSSTLYSPNALGDFGTLFSNVAVVAKSTHSLFSELDKLILKLNDSSRSNTPDSAASPRPERNSTSSPIPDDSIYSDDGAILLHDAIKQIGNPDAIGTHYSMTWDDIIRGGFRTISDFHAIGITSLEQLQKYLKEKSVIH